MGIFASENLSEAELAERETARKLEAEEKAARKIEDEKYAARKLEGKTMPKGWDPSMRVTEWYTPQELRQSKLSYSRHDPPDIRTSNDEVEPAKSASGKQPVVTVEIPMMLGTKQAWGKVNKLVSEGYTIKSVIEREYWHTSIVILELKGQS